MPLNRGGGRDIPPGATFHRSVLDRMKEDQEYKPINDVFVKDTAGCVEPKDPDKLYTVVHPGGDVPAIPEQPLRHLKFKQVERERKSKGDKDLYCIEKE